MRIRKKLLLILWLAMSTAGFAGCGYKPAPQPACNFVQNSYGQRVSWNNELPIPIYIHESLPLESQAVLNAAIKRWDDVLNRRMFTIAGIVRGENVPKRDGVSTIYWMDTWEESKTNEQARTTIYWDGSQIREADIRVNTRDFKYSLQESPTALNVDLESLLVHELGHALGLQHNDAAGSVMAVNLANGVERRKPQDVDVASLKCEY
jgi:hypothetical protein